MVHLIYGLMYQMNRCFMPFCCHFFVQNNQYIYVGCKAPNQLVFSDKANHKLLLAMKMMSVNF